MFLFSGESDEVCYKIVMCHTPKENLSLLHSYITTRRNGNIDNLGFLCVLCMYVYLQQRTESALWKRIIPKKQAFELARPQQLPGDTSAWSQDFRAAFSSGY